MRNGTYTAKRRASTTTSWQNGGARSVDMNAWSASGYTRNRNTVRQNAKTTFGPITTVGAFVLLLTLLGLTYVSQGARATQLDYDVAEKTSTIENLQAKRESLEEENTRLKSIAAAEKSEVAARMEDSKAAGYAE